MNIPKRPNRLPAMGRPVPIAAAMLSLGLVSFTAYAAPQGAVVRGGAATISQSGTSTRVDQRTDRAVIDWRSFSVDAPEAVLFSQPTRTSATLNRVTGDQLSRILGRIEANGQFVLVNPNGIIFDRGSQVNVGSLIATTANVSNEDFMAGMMRFVEPGKRGTGVANRGSLSVAEGGLVALVAPHVTNDGLIQARLGKVALGAGDTFTLDLYGDDLIHLALTRDQDLAPVGEAGKGLNRLISQAGTIDAAGGQVMLISAPAAKAVLDQVINLSGTIQADTAEQRNGRVVLLGRGGEVHMSGTISAQGRQPGQTGGSIEILGDVVHLTSSARVYSGGNHGGGNIHVGGAYQGQEATYRARVANVDTGARLGADSTGTGDAGNVVVWSDGQTSFAGQISARGGPSSGNGGQVEVSGKGRLDFAGVVDASATRGVSGTLLLDPAFLDIGTTEAGLISLIMRNGTSTTLTATADIRVNAMIDGRGGVTGAGLAMSAGRDLLLNQSIVTNSGSIDLRAGGRVINSAGTGLFSSGGAVSVSAGSGIIAGEVSATGGPIDLSSNAGNISLNGDLVTSGAGSVNVTAIGGAVFPGSGKGIYVERGDVILRATSLNVPVVSTTHGNVTLTGTDGPINLNDVVATLGGTVTAWSSGPLKTSAGKGIFTKNGRIALTAASIAVNGPLHTSGSVTLESTSGDIVLNSGIEKTNGDLTLKSANEAILLAPIQNVLGGHGLTIEATGDIHVEAQIGGQDAYPSGSNSGPVSLSSTHGSLRINAPISTNNSHILLKAGASIMADESGNLFSSGGDIDVRGDEGVALKNVIATKVSDCNGANCPLFTTGGFISIESQRGNIKIAGDVITYSDGSNSYDGIADTKGDIRINSTIGNIVWSGENISAKNGDLKINAGNDWVRESQGKLGAGSITVSERGAPNSADYDTEAGTPTPPTQNRPQLLLVDLPEILPISVVLPQSSRRLSLRVNEGELNANSAASTALPDDFPTYAGKRLDHGEISFETIIFTGGRGAAQSADLGRGGSIGNVLDVFLVPPAIEDEHRHRTPDK